MDPETYFGNESNYDTFANEILFVVDMIFISV